MGDVGVNYTALRRISVIRHRKEYAKLSYTYGVSPLTMPICAWSTTHCLGYPLDRNRFSGKPRVPLSQNMDLQSYSTTAVEKWKCVPAGTFLSSPCVNTGVSRKER